jgi:hypothetical protein
VPGIAALLCVALVAAACSSSSPTDVAEPPAPPPQSTPTTEAPGQGCDERVENYPVHVAWASEVGELPVYEQPDVASPVRTFPHPRMTDSSPPIEMPLAFLVKSEPKENDCQWVEVYLPTRPNGATGWVLRDTINMEGHVFRIEIFLSDFTLRAYQNETLLLEAPIATATDNTPTPGGLYYTTELLESIDPNDLYGPYAFGLSGFSDTLDSFNGGEGQLGIHGTNEPDRIGTQVSHGCIRLHNDDITFLAETLGDSTWLGIPVEIYA